MIYLYLNYDHIVLYKHLCTINMHIISPSTQSTASQLTDQIVSLYKKKIINFPSQNTILWLRWRRAQMVGCQIWDHVKGQDKIPRDSGIAQRMQVTSDQLPSFLFSHLLDFALQIHVGILGTENTRFRDQRQQRRLFPSSSTLTDDRRMWLERKCVSRDCSTR